MKYLGGKQRLGKHIAPILKELWEINTNQFQSYIEPFCGRDKNLVDFIGRTFFRPALADVPASHAGACKAAGHLAVRHHKVVGGKHGAQMGHGGLQPALAC